MRVKFQTCRLILSICAAFCGIIFAGNAAILVKDTWTDGSRTEPSHPTYTEFGTDTDGDGDIESAWYNSGPVTSITPGHMNTIFTNGGYATTYFAPTNLPVTLANNGDQIKVTWRFVASSVLCWSTEIPLAVGLMNTPNGSRLSSDAAPGSAAYGGYATFFGAYNNNLFGSMKMFKRATPAGPSQMFDPTSPGTAGWTQTTNVSAGSGGGGGGTFTLLVSATRNSTGGLEFFTSVEKDGVGFLRQASFTDSSPGTFSFNTFVVRDIPGFFGAGGWGVGVTFDTTRFQVESTNLFTLPAPPPNIRSIVRTNGTVNLTWDSVSGRIYQLQYATNVLSGTWSNLGSTITATNSLATASDSSGATLLKFYRVALLP